MKNRTYRFCINDRGSTRYSKNNDSIPEINHMHFGVTVSSHCDNSLIRVLGVMQMKMCGFSGSR